MGVYPKRVAIAFQTPSEKLMRVSTGNPQFHLEHGLNIASNTVSTAKTLSTTNTVSTANIVSAADVVSQPKL